LPKQNALFSLKSEKLPHKKNYYYYYIKMEKKGKLINWIKKILKGVYFTVICGAASTSFNENNAKLCGILMLDEDYERC
jgi:hypothetical protein